jgi:hypothetical protein
MKQQKRGRPASENPMVHTAVVLPRDLLERLRRDAEAADRGLSGEIRQRLQQSYGVDAHTAELIEHVKMLAHNLERDMGVEWWGDEYVRQAFKAGLASLIDALPSGDARKGPGAAQDGRPEGPADDPDVVGRTHARLVIKRDGTRIKSS